MINYVLGHFDDEERERLPGILSSAEEAVNAWLTQDIQKAMTFVNAENNPPE